MFAAMLFAISIVALAQFAVYYWRAILAGAAVKPVARAILESACVRDGQLSAEHFPALAELHDLTPDLDPSSSGLGLVRAYYSALQAFGKTLGSVFPECAAWADREGVVCARYAAVQTDRRLQANLALAASLRSC
jgi:hypothetical protein